MTHPHYPFNPYRAHSLMHKPFSHKSIISHEGYREKSGNNYCPQRSSCELIASGHKQCVYTSGTRVYKFRSEIQF